MSDALLSLFDGLHGSGLLLIGVGIFGAGLIRGFTGFGFALAAVPILTLVFDPQRIVPAVQGLALLAGAELLKRSWRQADRPAILRLLLGAALGTPIGVFGLGAIPADPIRLAIGLVLLAAILLLGRKRPTIAPLPNRAIAGIGFLSGLLNGATAMGGPPVIFYFLAGESDVARLRASLLVYFFFLSLWSFAWSAATGLIDGPALGLILIAFPAMALGNHCGDRLFAKSRSAIYRPIAFGFLAILATIAILRALANLLTG